MLWNFTYLWSNHLLYLGACEGGDGGFMTIELDDFKDLVWVVMDLNKNNKIVQAFEYESNALCLAGSMVGNMSYSGSGDIRLFGRGDGYTEVMVRQLPRKAILAEGITVAPGKFL